MNAKFLVALSLAVAGTAAIAGEATEFAIPASTLSRAAVQSQVATSKHDQAIVQYGEATVFTNRTTSVRSREDVRAEARAAAHDLTFNELYAG